ncbi:hypothetical protein WMY93_021679 [Mugilogobius chulae]|uniref:Non-muscle caldesmon n=1 Tax=Mugilogobius chulae TaxID=88201 RepID=A0AAW0NG11_9GOBI
MEEMDFERRRELRRQKREEMRLEAERLARTEDDEEEAARERRRRARQERMRNRENEENSSAQPETTILTNNHSVTESVSSSLGGGDEEDQALLERMAKREERRLRRMKEAMERQKLDTPDTNDTTTTTTTSSMEKTNNGEEERPSSWNKGRYRESEEEESRSYRREEKVEEAVLDEPQPAEEESEDKLQKSYLRDQEPAEEHILPDEEQTQEASAGRTVSESSDQVVSENRKLCDGVAQESCVYNGSDKTLVSDGSTAEVQQLSLDNEVNERGGAREEQEEPRPNGGIHGDDTPPKQHRKPERTPSRGSVRSVEVSEAPDEEEDAVRLEAERKLEELKRRRNDAESEEFERMRQKQQEEEAELEELRKKREERRKVLEEEERQRKQEEEQRKAREEEEKRRMKEEIEKRRAEAAEKRQKVDDTVDGDGKPFKCVSPRGSSLKIGERAEFLNKSAQKSSVKTSHSPVVSKIDNRLEQYTSAAQRENKESRSPRSGAVDLPLVTDIKNIKSMWEKGNVSSSPGGGSTFKEAAVMKTGVAGRINDWLNKTPESGKTSAGGRPTDLKPVDVTNKRSLWENKASPAKNL